MKKLFYLTKEQDDIDTPDPLTSITLNLKQLSVKKPTPESEEVIDLTNDSDSCHEQDSDTISFESKNMTLEIKTRLEREEIDSTWDLERFIEFQRAEAQIYIDNIPITPELICDIIRPASWLNDECINAYMRYMNALYPKILFHNTFLYSILNKKEYHYDRVKRWTKQYPKGSFSFDRIVIPINKGNRHWTLSCMDLIKKEISYYDSMGSGSPREGICTTLLNYLESEYNQWSTIVELEEFSRKVYKYVNYKCAQQSDGGSCGVYVCLYAKRLGEDKELMFDSKVADKFRVKLAYDLCMPFTLK